MRSLATIQEISAIKPIEGADAIEVAVIKDWQCVAKKGEFKTGDLCVYFKPESFLPVDERYEFLRCACYREDKFMGTGFRIKKTTIRSVISRGLALPVDAFPELAGIAVGEDVTDLLKVKKWDSPEIVKTSKFMSRVLRHKPRAAYITLDKNGWADVAELIAGMNRSRRTSLTFDDIKEVVEKNDKQRFSFNEDFTKIRANQGHSVKVDVELKEAQPPDVLYHGTAERFIESIKAAGLKPQGRLHVHLSSDKETAVKVGRRHGKPAVLIIDAGRMYADGFKFYLSENGVWLTERVPVEYVKY